MRIKTLLPDPSALRLERVHLDQGHVTLVVRALLSSGLCPVCGHSSRRVHSRYWRTLADLPWHGKAVRVQLEARKFFCDAPGCQRRIFAERLPAVARAHGRKTCRLYETIGWIGFALG